MFRTAWAVLFLLASAAAWGSSHVHQLADLADLSLEQLTQLTVTTASRRTERLVEAPASIYVIGNDDIRRSGATSLPEMLRLAPNVQVMRVDTNQYVISSRGGLTSTANKMLVLVDGRTIYTPLFSGVFYDVVTVIPEDVERIEVISGPGSTLWGTNAVNGVINVITRSAGQTQGALVAPVAGSDERGGSLRYGWRTGDSGAMRAYFRYMDRDAHRLASGGSARDAAWRLSAGVRGDWERGRDDWTFGAEFNKAEVGHLNGAREMSGAHVLGRWQRKLSGGSRLMVHGYLDHAERLHTGSFQEERRTFEVEMQHSWQPLAAHRLAWGAAYRASRDEVPPTAALRFNPAERTLSFTSLYAQDEVTLSERLRFTAGVRAERNSYTGIEWLPSARLSYRLHDDQFLWASVTRTVRSPSRLDRDIMVPGMAPFRIVNNETFDSEVAKVAELGYRGSVSARVSLSLTAFHHRFTDLRTLEPTATGPEQVISNGAEGTISGLEGWGDYRVSPAWRVAAGFTFLRDRTHVLPGRVNLTENPLGNNPKRVIYLHSQWNLAPAVEIDLMLRHVARLPEPPVPSYTELNARVGWRVSPNLELSLLVVNALDREHAEFGNPGARAQFDRAVLAKASWTY